MYLWSIIRFKLYILHLVILLLLHQFVGMPKQHQSNQILSNFHWHIPPPSHFGFSIFYIRGLHVVLQYKFSHFVEGVRRSFVLFRHHRLLGFLVKLLELVSSCKVLTFLILSSSKPPQFNSIYNIGRYSLERDPSHHMLSMILTKKR